MKRRSFLRSGILAAGAPLVLASRTSAGVVPEFIRSQRGVKPVRLSSNENPMGIPPVSREAVMAGMEEANRYPGTSRRNLINALARKHEVPADAIVLGNGSTEVLQMGVQARLDPALRLVAPMPTYEDVFEYSEPHPWIDLRPIPLLADYSHDLSGMERATRGANGPVLVYVCNPNNPTGSLTSVAEVEALIQAAPDNVHFIVDEAYFEYVDSPGYRSLIPLALANPNVVVARTFSKVFGMAGLRLGYGISHPDTARLLRSYAAGPNTNHLALVAALAALEDPEWVERSVAFNLRSRRMAYEVLGELDLEFIPSHTNFVMHRISGDLRQYIDRMAEAGIQVGRPFPPMLEFNRVSFGLPEEMEVFSTTLRDFRARGWV